MVFTTYGKLATSWQIGSNLSNNHIQCMSIGSGSGTAGITDVTLLGEKVRRVITGSPDYSTAREVMFQGDFNSAEMSGTTAMEFGLFSSGLLGTGSCWQREGFGSIVFDGTNELQIQTTIELQ